LQCWSKNCEPHILNNHEAYTECHLSLATLWNAIGVKNMERFISIPKNYRQLSTYHSDLLISALESFSNATAIDPKCWGARVNLALVLLQIEESQKAFNQIEEVIQMDKSTVRNWVIYGFIQDILGNRKGALSAWTEALNLDPMIGERKYYGIMVVDDTVPERHVKFPTIKEVYMKYEIPMALDILTYIEFSPISISNYAILPPGVEDYFIYHQYVILRDIVPPFVLRAVAHCFFQLQTNNFLPFGEHQTQRFTSYNSRTDRLLHYQLVDLFRRVILHNVNPTYSLFGGYIGGATLPAHTDKPQCEFTVTLTLQHLPENSLPWAISLGTKVKFDRDPAYEGGGNEELPSKDEMVNVDLYPGDCLIFMGRHLVHFRSEPLPDAETLQQLFLHHVTQDFTEIYDI